MRILDDIASKWHRTGGSWMPAAWPSGSLDVCDPILPVGTPATFLRWVPYPAPRTDVVTQAAAFVAQAIKWIKSVRGDIEHGDLLSLLENRFPDWPSPFPVSYTERRAALLIAIRQREEFTAWSRTYIRRFAETAYGKPLGSMLVGLAGFDEEGSHVV